MYKISDFAKLSRVSAKMLRHYDEIGLLNPARVDPSSDYRFYTAEQLPRLNRIVVLKDLGFTLQQIAALLDDGLTPEQIEGMLKLRRAEVEQRLLAEQQRLAEIAARLSQIEHEGQPPIHDVVLRPIAATPVATAQGIAYGDATVASLLDEVEWYVGRHRARAAQPGRSGLPLLRPGRDGGRGGGAAQQRASQQRAGAPRRAAGYPADGLPGPHGQRRQPRAAHTALIDWIAAHGYRIAGPTRELYLRYAPEAPPHLPPSFVAAQPDAAITEYQIPIVPA